MTITPSRDLDTNSLVLCETFYSQRNWSHQKYAGVGQECDHGEQSEGGFLT